MKSLAAGMIGSNGNADGNIVLTPLKIDNGTRIERNYSEKTVMDGGGSKQMREICPINELRQEKEIALN